MWWGEVAEKQHGLVTWDQGVDLVGRDRLVSAIERGLLVRDLPATYVVAGMPWSRRRDLMAACLCTGGVVSHRAAAWLHGFPGMGSTRTEITTTTDKRVRLPGVRAHRSAYLPPEHVTAVDFIPVTTPARMSIDISASYGDESLTGILSEAERRRLFTFADAVAVLHDVRRRGRRRVAHVAPILDYLMGLGDRGESPGEDWVDETLRRAGIVHGEKQAWVVLDGRRCRVDLLFRPERVVVEYDGYDAHGRTRTAFDQDRDRAAELVLAGYAVLQPTAAWTPTVLVDRVGRALQQRRPDLWTLSGPAAD